MKLRKLLFTFGFGLLFYIFLLLINNFIIVYSNDDNKNNDTTNITNTEDISNDDYDITHTSPEINIEGLDSFLSTYNVGFAYKNFDTNETYFYHANDFFVAASTVKIGIAMIVAEEIAHNNLSLDTYVTYTNDDYEAGTGSMQYDPIGTTYSIQTCIEKMLQESDNVATQILLRVVGRDYYQERMNQYVDGVFNADENMLNANQGLNLLTYLYDNPNDNPFFDQIITLLTKTEFDDRLSTYIDNELIAHKIGSFDPTYNDLALVSGDTNFAIAFFCDEGYEISNNLAAELGKYFFELNTSDSIYDTPSIIE